MKLFTILDKAWTAFWSNKKYLILTILVDFLFIFALAQIHLVYFLPSAQAMTKVAEAMSKTMQELPATEVVNLDSLLRENPDFMYAYRSLLTNIVLFFLSCFAAWLVFKTFAWYLTQKSIYKKLPLGNFALKFVLLSLFWFAILLAVILGYFGIVGQRILPLIGETLSTALMITLIVAVSYFANISFSLIPAQETFKKTFIYSVKHAKTIVPAYLVNVLLLFVTLSLPLTLLATKSMLGLAIIILITLPSLAFARINMVVATWLSVKSS